MFSGLLKLATLMKGIAALTLTTAIATGVASSTVALTNTPVPTPTPAASPVPTADLEALVRDCLAKYEALRRDENDATRAAAKEACAEAIAASGLTPDAFWATYGPKSSPKPTRPPQGDVEKLVRACVEAYEAARAAQGTPSADEKAARAKELCTKAIAATGLSTQEFFEKFLSKVQPGDDELVRACFDAFDVAKAARGTPSFDEKLKRALGSCAKLLRTRTPPSTKPTAQPGEVGPLVRECLAKYAALKDLKDASPEAVEQAKRAMREACEKAIAASGLTPDQFWAKFAPR